jgi:hypothetical protein
MPICTLSVSPWTMETLSIGIAEAVGDDLGEGRLVALAVAVRAGQDLDGADRVHPHFRRFPEAHAGAERAHGGRGRDPAGLDVAGVAEAPELAALGGFRLARGEARDVGGLQRLVEVAAEVAHVIGHDDGRLVREGGDEVPPAQFCRVHPHLARRRLHHPLDEVAGLGPPAPR